jgi:hypothetical protein
MQLRLAVAGAGSSPAIKGSGGGVKDLDGTKEDERGQRWTGGGRGSSRAARREQAVRVGGEEDDLNRKVGHHSWFLQASTCSSTREARNRRALLNNSIVAR